MSARPPPRVIKMVTTTTAHLDLGDTGYGPHNADGSNEPERVAEITDHANNSNPSSPPPLAPIAVATNVPNNTAGPSGMTTDTPPLSPGPHTIDILQAQLDTARAQLKAVTAERDALQAQLRTAALNTGATCTQCALAAAKSQIEAELKAIDDEQTATLGTLSRRREELMVRLGRVKSGL